MVKKAVYYGRVSTEEQADKGYSIEMQKERCIEWAGSHGYEIVEFFEDKGISGSKYCKLKNLQRLNTYISKNKIDIIICWKIDRISRNIVDFYNYTYKNVKDLGMTIASVMDFADINQIPHTGIAVLLGVATDEVENTKRRTKNTMRYRASQGYFMGKAPIGYLNRRQNGHGIIVVDEDNAIYIKKAFELYATGLYTMKSVSNELYRLGFKNKHNKPYPVGKIEHILKDILYVGKIKFGKNEDGTDYIVQGQHIPLISPELFKKVQTMRRNDGKPNTKHTDKTYSKLIKCSCGCTLTGYHSKGAHNSGDYIYYKCSNRKQAHTQIKGIKQETLDATFNSILSEIEVPQKVVELIKPKIVKALDSVHETENKVYSSNMKRLEELNMLIKKSNEERILGKSPLSESDFNNSMLAWQDEKESLLESNQIALKCSKNFYDNVDIMMKFISNLPDTYQKATIEGKQRLLRMIIEKVTYDTETQKMSVKLKPIFQALRMAKQNEKYKSEKVTTLRKVSNKTLLDYLAENVEISLKNKVTTLKRLLDTKKEPFVSALLKYGAGGGIRTHAYRNHNPRS